MCERSGYGVIPSSSANPTGRTEAGGQGHGGDFGIVRVAHHDAGELGAKQLIQRVHQVVFAGEVKAEMVELQLGQRDIGRGIHHQPQRVCRVQGAQRRTQLVGAFPFGGGHADRPQRGVVAGAEFAGDAARPGRE